MNDEPMTDDGDRRTRRAVADCAAWLAACVRMGWPKSDLDGLESLWWSRHDHRGTLVSSRTSERRCCDER
jgi:hypothetical protein